ncbi:MAG: CAP domain-containing protein [Chthoniobacterales bacterium]
MRRSLVLAILVLLVCLRDAPGEPVTRGLSSAGVEVVREMNLAREHPDRYAVYLEKLKDNVQGSILVLPDGSRFRAREGATAVNEAIRFLQNARPLAPLAFSHGMANAAAEHVADQVSGALGHAGSDQSDPAARLNRYGVWSGRWGENISYGKRTARDIVIALIIDDGLRNRKHRKNIFNAEFHLAGAAAGPHARYGKMCSIEFAAGYAESVSEERPLFARN